MIVIPENQYGVDSIMRVSIKIGYTNFQGLAWYTRKCVYLEVRFRNVRKIDRSNVINFYFFLDE